MNDFGLQNLQNKLPGFVHSWVMSLEPALPLFEESENGIFFEGEVQNLEMEFYERSTELRFQKNNIGYALDIPREYTIVIK